MDLSRRAHPTRHSENRSTSNVFKQTQRILYQRRGNLCLYSLDFPDSTSAQATLSNTRDKIRQIRSFHGSLNTLRVFSRPKTTLPLSFIPNLGAQDVVDEASILGNVWQRPGSLWSTANVFYAIKGCNNAGGEPEPEPEPQPIDIGYGK